MSLFWISFCFSASIEHAKKTPATPARTRHPVLADLDDHRIDPTEAELSSEARILQHRIRERAHQLEREADAESLYMLELVTAENSQRARFEDHQSLKALMQATVDGRWPQYKITTETKPASVPLPHCLKGLNGSSLSYAPSFPTPVSNNASAKPPSSGNEFEDFLARDSAARKRSSIINPKKIKVITNVDSRQASSIPTSGYRARLSLQARGQVAMVLSWFDELEQRDGSDDSNHQEATSEIPSSEKKQVKLKGDFEPIVDSPGSPTACIKHLAKNYGRLIKKRSGTSVGEIRHTDDAGDGDDGDFSKSLGEAQNVDIKRSEGKEIEENPWVVL